MSQYIITIVPVPTDDEPAGPASQTIVRIETVSGHSSVTELTMRAPEGASLVSGELPYVNFEMLLKAFIPPYDAAVASTATATADRGIPANRPKSPRRTSKPGSTERDSGTATPISRTAQTGHLRSGRAYRRMPDAIELETAYDETGTIAGVATHFGVPVHTAQGWISRLRRKNAEAANTA